MMMYIIIGIACLGGIIGVVLLLLNSGNQQQNGQKYRFELSAGGGRKITFADPFDNFLVYGGANSGKTKSIGKPLLSQYIHAVFSLFVYILSYISFKSTLFLCFKDFSLFTQHFFNFNPFLSY